VISNDTSPHKGARLRSTLFWALILMAFLAPIPMGSNRPVIWALWAAVIGFGLGLCIVRGAGLSGTLAKLWPILAVAMLPPIWGLFQILPIGPDWAGFPVQLPAQMRAETLSLSPKATLLAVLRMSAQVALFIVAVAVITRASRARLMLTWLFWGIAAHAVWAMGNLMLLGDIAIWGEKEAYFGNATGPFVNRNSFASYLGLGIVIGICLILDVDDRPRMRMPHRRPIFAPENLTRLTYGIAVILVFTTLLATQSRAGLLACCIGAAVAVAVLLRREHSPKADLPPAQRSARLAIFIGLVAVAVIVFAGQALVDRSIFTWADADGRLQIYQNALARITERPLTGYGLDAFALAYELGRSDDSFDAVIYTDAHSTYLENWVEGGLIFGSAMIVAAGLYLRRLRSIGPRPKLPTAVAIGALVLAAVHSAVDFSFEIQANVFLLIIILAIGVAPFKQRAMQK